jgi:heterodisulfide reductase subunit B
MLIAQRGFETVLPSILYPQLLGLGLGIDSEVLGIHQNRLELSGILSFLS